MIELWRFPKVSSLALEPILPWAHFHLHLRVYCYHLKKRPWATFLSRDKFPKDHKRMSANNRNETKGEPTLIHDSYIPSSLFGTVWTFPCERSDLQSCNPKSIKEVIEKTVKRRLRVKRGLWQAPVNLFLWRPLMLYRELTLPPFSFKRLFHGYQRGFLLGL